MTSLISINVGGMGPLPAMKMKNDLSIMKKILAIIGKLAMEGSAGGLQAEDAHLVLEEHNNNLWITTIIKTSEELSFLISEMSLNPKLSSM